MLAEAFRKAPGEFQSARGADKSGRRLALPELTVPGLHEALLDRVFRLPGITSDTAIVDLGCGSGAWLSRLARNGFNNLHGVDNNSFTDFQAGQDSDIGFTCADLDNSPQLILGDEKFGLITAIEVIEHVHNPGRFFNHVAENLARDGYFLMTTPNLQSVRARVRFALTGKLAAFDATRVPAELTHLYPVFLTCLERLLAEYGLKIVERWTYSSRTSGSSLRPLRLAAAILAKLLPDEYPGDTLCVLIRRRISEEL